MNNLSREDLLSLEQYAEQRNDFRAQVMAHKKNRRVAVGPNLTLYFEDRLTVQYQIQEMLRIERIFEADAIQEELDTYNPLISGGSSLRCTTMLEFTDVDLRRQQLAKLVGLEHKVWASVAEWDKVYAISNEDLERSTEEKTSAVHFMRFELTEAMAQELKDGADWHIGVQHPVYTYELAITGAMRDSLLQDLA